MDDAEAARALILWARSHQVVLGRVKVGAVELEILSMVQPAAALPTEAEAKHGLYAQYGGAALAAESDRATGATIEDDDDE